MYDEIRNVFKKKNPDQKAIFVIGTGRSGTHWLGYILQGHSNVKATIEDRQIFKIVTDMALDQGKKGSYFPKLINFTKNS